VTPKLGLHDGSENGSDTMNVATILLTVIIAWLLVRAVTYVRRRGMCAICEVRGCPLVNLKPAGRRSLVARLFKPVRQPPCGSAPSRRPAILRSDTATAAAGFDLGALRVKTLTELDLDALDVTTTDFDLRTLLQTPDDGQSQGQGQATQAAARSERAAAAARVHAGVN
jgi:hypothetical protein